MSKGWVTINDEIARLWKEAVVAYLMICCNIVGTEENNEEAE